MEKLFEPIEVGGLRLANRIVIAPSTAEYWHIGAITMRFERASVPMFIG